MTKKLSYRIAESKKQEKRLLKTLLRIERIARNLYAVQDADRGMFGALTAEEQDSYVGKILNDEILYIEKVLHHLYDAEDQLREILGKGGDGR